MVSLARKTYGASAGQRQGIRDHYGWKSQTGLVLGDVLVL
jgi:hypothetical protein